MEKLPAGCRQCASHQNTLPLTPTAHVRTRPYTSVHVRTNARFQLALRSAPAASVLLQKIKKNSNRLLTKTFPCGIF